MANLEVISSRGSSFHTYVSAHPLLIPSLPRMPIAPQLKKFLSLLLGSPAESIRVIYFGRTDARDDESDDEALGPPCKARGLSRGGRCRTAPRITTQLDKSCTCTEWLFDEVKESLIGRKARAHRSSMVTPERSWRTIPRSARGRHACSAMDPSPSFLHVP